jgi:phosphoribosylanthranilate isomerase
MFVKICGTTSEEDALLSVAMGADAVGFVFAPSPRQVKPQTVADIVKRLPREVLTVGVFRDEAPARVVEIVNTIGLRAAQLHGHETPADAHYVRQRVPLLIQAFPAGDPAVARAAEYRPDAVLLDAATPGSGQVFDWSMAEVPDGIRLILAGGLTPANVGQAIAQVHPWGVDVATGVESSPGRKDAVKVRAFVAAARAAAPERDGDDGDGDGDELAPYDWDMGGT